VNIVEIREPFHGPSRTISRDRIRSFRGGPAKGGECWGTGNLTTDSKLAVCLTAY
jgi:hypothetical protein